MTEESAKALNSGRYTHLKGAMRLSAPEITRAGFTMDGNGKPLDRDKQGVILNPVEIDWGNTKNLETLNEILQKKLQATNSRIAGIRESRTPPWEWPKIQDEKTFLMTLDAQRETFREGLRELDAYRIAVNKNAITKETTPQLFALVQQQPQLLTEISNGAGGKPIMRDRKGVIQNPEAIDLSIPRNITIIKEAIDKAPKPASVTEEAAHSRGMVSGILAIWFQAKILMSPGISKQAEREQEVERIRHGELDKLISSGPLHSAAGTQKDNPLAAKLAEHKLNNDRQYNDPAHSALPRPLLITAVNTENAMKPTGRIA